MAVAAPLARGGAGRLQQVGLARTGTAPQPQHARRRLAAELLEHLGIGAGDEAVEARGLAESHAERQLLHAPQPAVAARSRDTTAARRV